MAWTSPHNWTGGETITEALLDAISNNESVLSTHAHTGAAGDGAQAIGSASLPIQPITEGCICTHSTTQTIGSGATAALAFDTESSDVGALHDTVTNNSRIVLKSVGNWLITAQVYASAGSGLAYVNFRLNGATTISIAFPGSGGYSGFSMVYRNSAVTDYLEVMATGNGGGSTTVSNSYTRFTAQRIG